MKKLIRPEEVPVCLKNFTGGRDNWNEVDKENIWLSLDIMQNGFCAYCECRLNRKHIEHFGTRHANAALTFDWHNLFGSCGDSSQKGGWKRCGIYKDNGAGEYSVDELIKPDEDDPERYLFFLTSGEVQPRKNLNDTDRLKTKETIRVFNLNGEPNLFNSRKQAIRSEQAEIEALYELQDEFSPEEWEALLQENLTRISELEFSTALIHAWRYNNAY